MSYLPMTYIILLCLVSFETYQCCPAGFTQCARESYLCGLAVLPESENVIAFGADGHRFAYQQLSGEFVCNITVLCYPVTYPLNSGDAMCDPVVDIGKECCYQTNKITNIPASVSAAGVTWAAGNIECNQRVNSYISAVAEEHVYKFTTTITQNVYFSNCESSVSDTKLYLYDNAGNSLMHNTEIEACCGLFCLGNCGSCDGDDCGDCGSNKETFHYSNLPAGSYWVIFAAFSGFGNYVITIECPASPAQHDYAENVVTCLQNSISSATSTDNRKQYFQVTTMSQVGVTFKSCDTSYDSQLFIYYDSLYENQLAGGDNDACSSGYQESYTSGELSPGNYYVQMDTASGCQETVCYGSNTFSIECHPPTPKPTRNPTMSTNVPTNRPTNHPTLPTADPTKNPTVPTTNPTTSPTKYPSNPTSTPSSTPSTPTDAPTYDTSSPTFSPSPAPTAYPTSTPTRNPSYVPTSSPTLSTFSPSYVPTASTAYPTSTPTRNPSIDPTNPTINPTNNPSDGPSSPPTYTTKGPTKNPTNNPSVTPSTAPSIVPTQLMTSNINEVTNLDQHVQQVETTIHTTWHGQRNTTENDSNSGAYITVVIIIICLLFGSVVLFYIFWRKKKTNTSTDAKYIDSNTNNVEVADICHGVINTPTTEDNDVVTAINKITAGNMDNADDDDDDENIIANINQTTLGVRVMSVSSCMDPDDFIIDDGSDKQTMGKEYGEYMENDENELVEGVSYCINEDGAKQLKTWLDSIGFIGYYDVFLKNGFDSLEMIQEINNQSDLNNIGITLKGHQLKIMNHIQKIH